MTKSNICESTGRVHNKSSAPEGTLLSFIDSYIEEWSYQKWNSTRPKSFSASLPLSMFSPLKYLTLATVFLKSV